MITADSAIPPVATMEKNTENVNPNGWFVLLELVRGILRLAQSGNIIGLLLVALVVHSTYITYKLPPQMLDKQITTFVVFLSREKFYVFPLSASIFFILIFCFYRCKMLREEIRRMAEVRSALMHGLEKKELTQIKKHHPSNFTLQ